MKKYYYLHKEEVFEFEEPLMEGYSVSENVEEQETCYVRISEEEAMRRRQIIEDSAPQEYSPEDVTRLRIGKSNPFIFEKTEDEIKSIDVTMLDGLTNEKKYSRGYKIWSKFYSDKSGNELAVERMYSLVYEGSVLVGERCRMIWYNEDGTIAFNKEQVEHYSAKDAAKKLKDIRETQMLYLQNPESEFVSPAVKKYIDSLFNHYKSQVSDYILNGSKDLAESVKKESNAQIKAILNHELPDGKTVKESILYQIEG